MSKSREVKTAASYCDRAIGILKKAKEDDCVDACLDHMLRCYNRALQLDPNCARAFHGIGYIHGERSQYDLAVKNYLIAISKNNLSNERLANVYFHCGISYRYLAKKSEENAALRQEYFEKEYDCYTQAISFDPKHQDVYLARARISVVKDDLKGAICDLSKAIDAEEKEVAETTKLKNKASEQLIWILETRSKDKILEAIQGIEDRDTKILLLKKCLNKDDPELGAKFFKSSSRLIPSRLGVSSLAAVERYFRSIDPEAATAYLKEIAPRYTSKLVEQGAPPGALGMFASKPKIPHPQRDPGSDGVELLPASGTPRRESK